MPLVWCIKLNFINCYTNTNCNIVIVHSLDINHLGMLWEWNEQNVTSYLIKKSYVKKKCRKTTFLFIYPLNEIFLFINKKRTLYEYHKMVHELKAHITYKKSIPFLSVPSYAQRSFNYRKRKKLTFLCIWARK